MTMSDKLQIFDAQCARCGQPQSKHDKKVVNGGIGVGDRSVVQVCPEAKKTPLQIEAGKVWR
jgi:formylmethanofuran dehydrogenase subunit E